MPLKCGAGGECEVGERLYPPGAENINSSQWVEGKFFRLVKSMG